MKKKISILTQPIGTNYGGMIQNYALQFILKKAGFEPITINRLDNNYHSNFKRELYKTKLILQKLLLGKNIFTVADRNEIYKNNTSFLNKHITLTDKIERDDELKKHFQNNHYDAVIVGSDQTWRPPYSPNIYNYFLDFLVEDEKIRKLVYATSYGTSNWEFSPEETQRCKELAQQFDAISVREESGVGMTEKYFERESLWVVDPTLLLNKSDYLELIAAKSPPDQSGIYTYILDDNPLIENLIQQAQQTLDLPHFTAQPKVRGKHKSSKKLADYVYPGVEEWLKGFADADIVITDSFHGTVFSIIFNKPFVVLTNKERGAARFYSLLGRMGLEDRIVDNPEIDAAKWKNLVQQPIDFTKANEEIKAWKKESLEFLLENLK